MNNRNRPHKWSVILTQSSAVPMFLRSIGLFQPVKPNLVRNRTKLCNIHRLWSRAGHSGRMLTRISSLSTHWRDRCKLSFVFCQRKWKAICIRYHSWYISITKISPPPPKVMRILETFEEVRHDNFNVPWWTEEFETVKTLARQVVHDHSNFLHQL